MDRALLKGTFVITFGIIVSKILSLFFIFPFSNMVGPAGLSLYSYAYIPYTLFLDISTLGIPLGIAKAVSIYDVEGKYKTIKKLLKASLFSMLIVSIFSFILLNSLSLFYAKTVLGDSTINSLSSVKRVINIVSLAILIIPFVSVFRGYFQGKRKMFVLSMSQILEQVIRVSFILITCYLLYKQGYEKPVNMAVFAAFISGIGALVFLIIFYIREEKLESNEEVDMKIVFKDMIRYAIPFSLVGLNFALYNLSDSLFFNRALGLANSEVIYGIYSFEIQRLINIPIALAIGFSVNLMPCITSSLVKNDNDKIQNQIKTSYHTIFLIVLPVVLLCMLYSNEIYSIFFHNVEYGGRILFSCAPLILIFSLNNITNSIMQGLGKGKTLMINLLIGIAIKFVFNYLFINKLGYSGAILLTSISLIIVMIINIIHIKKYIDYKQIVKDFFLMSSKALVPLFFTYLLFRNSSLPNILNVSLIVTFYFVLYCAIIKTEIHNLIIGDASGKEGTI